MQCCDVIIIITMSNFSRSKSKIENCFCYPPTCLIKIKELSYFNLTFLFFFTPLLLSFLFNLFFITLLSFTNEIIISFSTRKTIFKTKFKADVVIAKKSKFRSNYIIDSCENEFFFFYFYLLNLWSTVIIKLCI